MASTRNTFTQLDAPMGALVGRLGRGVGLAQVALLKSSLDLMTVMGGARAADRVQFGGQQRSLLELGFRPTFYDIREAALDIRLTCSRSRRSERRGAVDLLAPYGPAARATRVSPLTVRTVNRYQIHHSAVSRLRTRIAPTPAPAALTAHIEASLTPPAGAMVEG